MAWVPQAGPQLAAIEADWCDELFYGGERGGGKSDFQLGYQEDGALRYGKHSNGIMFRKTYPEMEELQSRAVEIFSASGAVFRTQPSSVYPFSNCWYWPNGATVKMRYIENEKDYGRYHGHQYTRISFDEVAEYATPDGLLKMLSTLRSANGVPCSMRSTGNPGGVGHVWVKTRYIDPAPPFTPYTDPDTGFTRMFVPSKLSDNQILVQNDPNYRNRILAATDGNEALRKAWTEGAWDIVAGAFFSAWSKKVVIAPVELPQDWTRFCSMDWGSARPFSVGWWAVSDGSLPQFPRGAMIRYREWYGMIRPNIGLKMKVEAVAAGIISREKNERIDYRVADPAIFSEDGGPSIAQGLLPLVWKPGDNKRIPGWTQLNDRLIGMDDKPMIYFFNTCIDTIRTVPAQQHDKHKIEDIDSDGEDHCFAAGTMVDTDRGAVPIEQIVAGVHKVWSGSEWQDVLSARPTRKAVPVLRVIFENGVKIVCTPDHKYLDFSDEWRYAKDLANKEVLCSPKSLTRISRSLTERFITCAASISKTRENGCIGLYGPSTTETYPKGHMSTIRIATGPTTAISTLNVSPCRNIWANVTGKHRQREASTLSLQHKRPQRYGMAAKRVGNGTLNTTKSVSGVLCQSESLLSVVCVAKSTWLQRLKRGRVSGAAQIAKPVRCVSVEGWGKADVYCLTVPEPHRFTVEGGLVVHNCADEIRYACMSRPWVRPKPEPEVVIDRWDKAFEGDDSDDDWKTV